MSFIENLFPMDGVPKDVSIAVQRIVPLQPDDPEPGHVFLGDDLGWVRWSGHEPIAGDRVTVVGDSRQRICLTGAAPPPMRMPLFQPGGCKCKCPSDTGIVFAMSPVQRASVILAMDESGALLQAFGAVNLLYGRALAVDTTSPYDLWVLDDRRQLYYYADSDTLQSSPLFDYFWLVRFTIQSGSYQYLSQHFLGEPGGSDGNTGRPFSPQDEVDPPDFIHACLSVISSVPHITMWQAPARFLTFDGTDFATQTLTLDGESYDKALRGNVVTVADKPAKSHTRYVLGVTAITDGGETTISEPELIAFNSDYEITQRIDLSETFTYPSSLASVCNRLLLLDTTSVQLSPTHEDLG